MEFMTATIKQSECPADAAEGVVACRNLEPLFAPRGIAVVGASRREGSVGYAIMQNLLDANYQGVLYPVNPQARSLFGHRCVSKLSEINDDQLDLIVVVIPAPYVLPTIKQGVALGVKNFVVISAGFKEVGGEGLERELALKAYSDENGLNILGPNCLGIINTHPDVCMNASFGPLTPARGNIGLISQSGALCSALLDYAGTRGIGFSRFVSFGNKADISEVDLMLSLAQDEQTDAILMYVEAISDGRKFVDAAQQITRGPNAKPILMIKTGRTSQGAAAAASHTGSMAGSDEVYDALLEQAGVIRVDSVETLFDVASCFSDKVLPAGRRTAIVTNAGGPGIMATDACITSGLELCKFEDYTIKSLQFQLPAAGSFKNPVDVIGDARHDRYRAALDAVASDDNVDQIMVIVTPQTMTNTTQIAREIGETRKFCNKPVVACLMGAGEVHEGAMELRTKYNLPTYTFPESAAGAMMAKCRFAEWTRTKPVKRDDIKVNKEAAGKILDDLAAKGITSLVEAHALQVLEAYGFPTVPFKLATNADEAVAAAAKMDGPVVLKIAGPKILHKSDVGGVALNLNTAEEVKEAYTKMIATVKERMGADVEIWGVLVQKMLGKGREIILGLSRDATLGPLIMYGMGGIYTEVFKDVAFNVAPLDEADAKRMIAKTRSAKLLDPVRGSKAADKDALLESLLKLSQFVVDFPQVVELDINPLVVFEKGQGCMSADARIILSGGAS
jgi:acetyltransferase